MPSILVALPRRIALKRVMCVYADSFDVQQPYVTLPVQLCMKWISSFFKFVIVGSGGLHQMIMHLRLGSREGPRIPINVKTYYKNERRRQ